ncbi:SLC25A29 family protein [Megaselia abdita]
MDTIKVHLQTQDVKTPKYKGTFHCFRSIMGKEGPTGLYRGITSPLGGVALVNAVVFGVYGNIQRNVEDPNSIKSHFLAGTLAGLAQSFICSPMELAKTRLQVQEECAPKNKLKGPLHCFKHIFRTEGFRGIFRGLGITALRDVPGFASYFVSYELMMRQIATPTAFHTLVAGGLAGTISWLLTFPIDTVKSRLQADGMSGRPVYSGMLHCARHGYEAEGLAFFSRGLSSTLIRAFVMNAATFLVVSYTMKASENFRLGLEVHPETLETLAVVGASSVPIVHPSTHLHNFSESNEVRLKRASMIKSLVYSGTFTEAVCHTEMIELANDLHSRDEPYYLLDECSGSLLRVRDA